MQYKQLTIEERERIQELRWERKSIRFIAQDLHRSPASISRELRRNYPLSCNRYTPRLAHERALSSDLRRGRTDLLKNERVRAYVTTHLKRRWSPEQIAGTIQEAIGETISHEAVYQYIYAQCNQGGYGQLKPGKEDLRSYLRRRKKRRTPQGTRTCQKITKTEGMSIDLRPPLVDDRSRYGDWEGDSVESVAHKPGINTLLERKSRCVCITKLYAKTARETTHAVTQRMQAFPASLRRTLTLDQGSENTGWKAIEEQTGIACFFAHAYHAYERGANENVNGLIRDYFPKKTDFTQVSEAELAYVEHELNTSPRKRLGYKTPLQMLGVALQG